MLDTVAVEDNDVYRDTCPVVTPTQHPADKKLQAGPVTSGEYEYSECTEYWGLVDRMDGMCVALGYVYRMNGFIVNRVLRGIARDRLVLALAQEVMAPGFV